MIPQDDKERAQMELQAIDDLKKFPAFAKYYLPRLAEKQAALATRILEDDKIDAAEREKLRAVWKEYRDLRKMMDIDAAVALGKINPPAGRG